MQTLIQIVTEVCRRIGQPVPNAVLSSTDPGVLQLLALANEEGQELASIAQWTALTKEQTFTTTATESQGDIDGDIVSTANAFDFILNETFWDRTNQRPLVPLNGPEWQAAQAASATGPIAAYRIRGGELLVTPTPDADLTYAFEYITKNWVLDTQDVPHSEFTADDDTVLLDDRAIRLGIIWRWKKEKGLDYAEALAAYEKRVLDLMTRDGGRKRASLNGASAGAPASQGSGLGGSWGAQ